MREIPPELTQSDWRDRRPLARSDSALPCKTARAWLDHDLKLRLLPSQQQTYEQLVRLTEQRSLTDPALVIAIDGDWGTGKTYVLQALSQRYATLSRQRTLGDIPWKSSKKYRQHGYDNDSSPPNKSILVTTNVWSEATEQEFHLALYERLLEHPEVPAIQGNYWVPACCRRWFGYPLKLISAYLLQYCGKVLAGGRVTMPGGMSISLTLSDMLWRRDLDQRIHELRQAGYRVIWALDDLDRTSPEMAQAALSVIRRFLNHPGSIVLLPYVRSQLRHKVFNPLIATRSDIEATMFGVLQEAARKDARVVEGHHGLGRVLEAKMNDPFPGGSSTTATATAIAGGTQIHPPEKESEPLSTLGAFSLAKWFPSNFGQNLTPEAVAVLLAAEPTATFSRYLKASLVDFYLHQLSSEERLKLTGRFEEKYLHQAPVRIRRLTYRDLPRVPVLFTELLPLTRSTLTHAGTSAHVVLSPENIHKMYAGVEASLRALSANTPKRGSPPVRLFVADLIDKLSAFENEYTDSDGDATVGELVLAVKSLLAGSVAPATGASSFTLGITTSAELAAVLSVLPSSHPALPENIAVNVYAMLVYASYRQITLYEMPEQLD